MFIKKILEKYEVWVFKDFQRTAIYVALVGMIVALVGSLILFKAYMTWS